MPAPICATPPLPEIVPAKVAMSVRLKASVAIVEDVAEDAAVGAAIAELQRAGRDRRAAAYRYWPPVRIVVPVPICATPPLPEIVAGEGRNVGAVEGQRPVVDDVAEDAAVGAAVAELQRAGRDRRAAAIGIDPGENDGSAGAAVCDDDGARRPRRGIGEHAAECRVIAKLVDGVRAGAIERKVLRIGRAGLVHSQRSALKDGIDRHAESACEIIRRERIDIVGY